VKARLNAGDAETVEAVMIDSTHSGLQADGRPSGDQKTVRPSGVRCNESRMCAGTG
jgi:hypothetical protein